MNHIEMWRFRCRKKKHMEKTNNDHNLIHHSAQRATSVMWDVRAYDLTNPWDRSGGFKENVVNLAMMVVMNTTDAHIVHFLSNSLDDEAEWTFSSFADYAKLWEEVEILKGRVSDQGSLIVWRTESENNLQSSPRRNWISACGLGSALTSCIEPCKAWELTAEKELQ